MQQRQWSEIMFEDSFPQSAIHKPSKNFSSLSKEEKFKDFSLHRMFYSAFSVLLAILILFPTSAYSQSGTSQVRKSQTDSFSPILVGMEYAALDNLNHFRLNLRKN